MPSGFRALAILIVTLLAIQRAQTGGFSEQLWLEEAEPGRLLAQLHFTASAPSCSPDVGFFPLALKRIAVDYGVRDLELSLVRGRAPCPSPSQQHALPPAGLIFKSQFLEGVSDTKSAFEGLTESLGGVLAVPLGRLQEDGVVAGPLVGWFGTDRGVVRYAARPSRDQVYASLPWEGCCTDQLAAWANLLPCRQAAGLAALLDPMSVAAAPYFALQLRLSREGANNGSCCSRGSGRSNGSCGAVAGQPEAAGAGAEGKGEARCARCAAIRMHLSMAILSLPEDITGAAGQEGGPSIASAREGVEAAAARLLQRVLGRPMSTACQAAVSSSILIHASLLYGSEHGGPADSPHNPLVEGTTAEGLLCALDSSSSSSSGSSSGSGSSSSAPGWVTCSLGRTPVSPGIRHGSNTAGAMTRAAWLLLAGEEAGKPTTLPRSTLRVGRHIVPQGPTRGELVLSILASSSPHGDNATIRGSRSKRSEGTGGAIEGARQEGSGSGLGGEPGTGGQGGEPLLHIFQPVPWQLPIQLHTLRLAINGQDIELPHPYVAWHHLFPAGPPSVPGVLELLLQLPATGAEHRVTLAVGFKKRLLSVFQHPPDASRGVDIPAAEVTLVPAACAGPGPSTPAPKQQQGSQQLEERPAAASACIVRRAYSAAHLVPLPIPDLSMPFNVCCFAGTVMALYFGGVLNALLRPAQGDAPSSSKPRFAWWAKLRRVLALLLLGAVLAFYLDKDLQRAADKYLHWLALGRGGSLPAGEL